jgi:NitT/TauT family transport system substrate-binding protein
MVTLVIALAIAACAGQSATSQAEPEPEPEAAPVEPAEVHVASLKGPTSIGLASFMGNVDTLELNNTYTFTIATAADEILPAVIKGEVDIALIPANAAAVLYNKTEGGISVIDINTLGVLNVVTGDESIQQFADLAGKTVYMTGKGATPEYAMNFLLNKAGIADQVTLEFKSEPTEVVQALSADATAVGVLPQPFATAACVKNEALKAVIDLTDVWASSVDDGSQLLTGVTIVRNEFLAEHPEAVAEFIEQQAASVDAANADPAGVAPLVVAAGIIDAEPVAAKAIPSCHLVCITGAEMQSALSGYLQTLFDSDPASVGGALPTDSFYFLG